MTEIQITKNVFLCHAERSILLSIGRFFVRWSLTQNDSVAVSFEKLNIRILNLFRILDFVFRAFLCFVSYFGFQIYVLVHSLPADGYFSRPSGKTFVISFSIHSIASAGVIRQYVGQGLSSSTSERPFALFVCSSKACFTAFLALRT